MTITKYREMLLARQRLLYGLEGNPPGGEFRGLPQAEIDGRLAELRNALNMLDCVEEAGAIAELVTAAQAAAVFGQQMWPSSGQEVIPALLAALAPFRAVRQ